MSENKDSLKGKIPDNVYNRLLLGRCELYSLAKHFYSSENEVIFVKDERHEHLSLYHSLYRYKGSYYDISGKVAKDIFGLFKYIQDNYSEGSPAYSIQAGPSAINSLKQMLSYGVIDDKDSYMYYIEELLDDAIESEYENDVEMYSFILDVLNKG